MISPEEQFHIIQSGAAQIVPEKALMDKLKRGKPLNIKLGVDPTAPDIHLGHAVPLRKLRQFQDLGHQVTLIIGDGTALIGDPSGRNSTRPQLTREQIKENAQTYVDQAFKVLDPEKTTLRYNSEWILSLGMEELLKIASNFTVARILERDDFHNRYTSELPISLHEFLYPIMQAYDSVVIKADVELGGTDQLFNLLAGRELMEKMGMEPQVCLTLPLLEGTDGVKKMSKSYGNYIGLTDAPNDMFGKVMSISDDLMWNWYDLLSLKSNSEIETLKNECANGRNPREAKVLLAKEIVERFHTSADADAAEVEFNNRFRAGEMPSEIPEVNVAAVDGEIGIGKLIKEAGMVPSVGEANRNVDQGGVRVNGDRVTDRGLKLKAGTYTIQVGKRKWAKVTVH